MEIGCGSHVWHAFGMTFCGETLIDTWIVSLIVLAWGLLATRRGPGDRLGTLQNAWEMIWEFVGHFIGERPTERQRYFLNCLLMALFLFVLGSNFLGLLPGMHSPTNTLNTDFALAAVVFFLVQGWAFFAHRGAGLRRLIHGGAIGWVMLPITVLEEFAKPVTLAMRLFGNILAGELIVLVLLQLLPLHTFLFLGFIPHVLWLAFGIFVGSIQAFIFMVLTLAYVGQSTAEEHGH
jgi:F-type H+-transporting ATPase subunit a